MKISRNNSKNIKIKIILFALSLIFTNSSYSLSQEIQDQVDDTTVTDIIDNLPAENETTIQPSELNNSLTPDNEIFPDTIPPLNLDQNPIAGVPPSDSQSALLLKEIPLRIAKEQVPITLEQSLKKALENNFDVKVITAQKNQNKWMYYNSLSEYLPDINYSYVHTRFTGSGFLLGGFVPTTAIPALDVRVSATIVESDLVGRWNGFTGFSRLFNAIAAKSKYNAAKKELEFTKDQTLVQVATQYYNLLRDKINIDIQKVSLQQTEAQLALNQARFNEGVGTKFDVLRSETEVARFQQRLIKSFNRLKLSQAQLANTMGINVFTPLMPIDGQDGEVEIKKLVKEDLTLDKITQIAIRNRPDISAAEFDITAAKAERNAGFSPYLPTVGVQGLLQHIGSDISNLGRNQSVALVINWTGGENLGLNSYTKIRDLNEKLKENKLKALIVARNVEQNIINSYYDSISRKEVIKATEKEVISSEESLRLSMVRLKAGVGIYTDVIAAQLAETNAKVSYLNAIIDYNIAQAQLLFDMGIISLNNLTQGYNSSSKP